MTFTRSATRTEVKELRLQDVHEIRDQNLLEKDVAMEEFQSKTVQDIHEIRDQNLLEKDVAMEEFQSKTVQAINRMELNDAALVRRLEESVRAAKLNDAALVRRLEESVRAAKARTIRGDFSLWVAAAVTIQRAFRVTLFAAKHKIYEQAITLITRNPWIRMAITLITRNLWIRMFFRRIRKKHAATPTLAATLAGFLRNAANERNSLRFIVRKFHRQVVRIQRFIRLTNAMKRHWVQAVFPRWDKLEARFRTELRKSLATADPIAARRPNLAMSQASVRIEAIPLEIKRKHIKRFLDSTKRDYMEGRKVWANQLHQWIAREEYRYMVEQQKHLLQGGSPETAPHRDRLGAPLTKADPRPHKPPLIMIPPDAAAHDEARENAKELANMNFSETSLATKRHNSITMLTKAPDTPSRRSLGRGSGPGGKDKVQAAAKFFGDD
ncbi:hypothetical protein T484DRAFT_1814725 [Baffinella frigidus]|nr:hypothetical protein T484DRAFT_1814725 [Cryptophyta sp. CCMP2293]